MDSVQNQRKKTLEDLRLEANLQKSDIYKHLKVNPRTYENWIDGKTLPDLSKAVELARVLKTPLINIFGAFNIKADDVIGAEYNPQALGANNSVSDASPDVSDLVSVLKGLPDDKAAVVMHWLLSNKKDGGNPPPSSQPT